MEIPVGALLRALQKVKESPKADTGICYLVEDHLEVLGFIGSAEEIIGELATSWPKWSGDGVYPVPCPESYLDRSREDPHCWAFCSLPKWEEAYGDLRMELLDFLINELERANE